MNQTKKTRLFFLIFSMGMIASFAYHYYLSHYCGLNFYPYKGFLFIEEVRFSDFYDIFRASKIPHPFQSRLAVYFPFTFSVLRLIPRSFSDLQALCLLSSIFILFQAFFTFRWLSFLNLFERIFYSIIICFSYPSIFCFDRGNLESIVFMFSAMGILFFASQRWTWSGVFIALSSAIKAYPGVFFVMLLMRGKYKLTKNCCIFVVIISLLAAHFSTHGIWESFRLLYGNLRAFKHNYVLADDGLQHASSLYAMIRTIIYPDFIFQIDYLFWQRVLSLVWGFIGMAGFFASLGLIFLCRHTTWKIVFVLVADIILLPQVSFNYKLIHLLAPVCAYLADRTESRFDKYYVTILALLMVPKDYGILFKNVSTEIILNPLLFIGVIGLILKESSDVDLVQLKEWWKEAKIAKFNPSKLAKSLNLRSSK